MQDSLRKPNSVFWICLRVASARNCCLTAQRENLRTMLALARVPIPRDNEAPGARKLYVVAGARITLGGPGIFFE